MSLENKSQSKVWAKFDGTRKDGSVVKLRIQDLDWDEHKEEIKDFVLEYFVKDEAFHKAAGISNNKDAELEYRELLNLARKNQKPHVSVCYVDDDSQTNEIVGISTMTIKKALPSDDSLKEFKPKTKELQNLFNLIEVIRNIKGSKDDESINPVYEGRGISVRPDYRGLGIAREFVRLRKQVCIDNNIPLTNAWMTSIGTQKAADRYNWKILVELPVEELARSTGLTFEVNVPTFKLMYTTRD